MTQSKNLHQKVLPAFGNGVVALMPSPGMEGVPKWLMFEKIHKYWPIMSRLSYSQLLKLTDENWDQTFHFIRGSPLTSGPKRKILTSVAGLRSRHELLERITCDTELVHVNKLMKWIFQTPLANEPEHDGNHLISTLCSTLTKVIRGLVDKDIDKDFGDFLTILAAYLVHPAVPQHNKDFIYSLLIQDSPYCERR